MRAMILAAGRGERMKSLTHRVPKPLLRVGTKFLIEHVIEKLAAANFKEIVINVCYRGDQIKDALGDGKRLGVTISYSEESERLETGGGIFKALPLLGTDPFLVVSSDIITDFDFTRLPRQPQGLAHLVLVDNPDFHPHGDFGLNGQYVDLQASPALTFANIGVYRRELFAEAKGGYFPLSKLLFHAIRERQITGEYFSGQWYNVGTPGDLEKVNQLFAVS